MTTGARRLLVELGLAAAFPRTGLHHELAPQIVRGVRRAQVAVRSRLDIGDLPPREGPRVYCAFHFRGHFGVPRALSKHCPFAMITDAGNFAHVHEAAPHLFHSGWGELPSLINANEVGAAYRMYKHLERGGNLLVYGDGNDGSGDPYFGGNSAHLFGLPINFRAGFLRMAALSGAPISLLLPTPGRRRVDATTLNSGGEAEPGALLGILERYVRRDPYKWDEWHQLPYWIDFDSLDEINRPQDPGGAFAVKLKLKGSHLLFDRATGAISLWRNARWETVI